MSGQVRSGQVMSAQLRSGLRTGHVRTGQVKEVDVKEEHVIDVYEMGGQFFICESYRNKSKYESFLKLRFFLV